MLVRAIVVLMLSLVLSSCAVMMPYAEEPLCRKSVSGGYCGSLSDVYDATNEAADTRAKQTNTVKKQPLR